MSALAGCSGGTAGNAGNVGTAVTEVPTKTKSSGVGRTTRTHTSISATPENGKFVFVNNTDYAVCSLELEHWTRR